MSESIESDVKMLREALQDTELVLSESVAWAGIWACSPDRIKRVLDALEAARAFADKLTGEKFSDRVHVALQSRARVAESRLARAVELLRELQHEVGEDGNYLPSWGAMDRVNAFLKEQP